MTKLVLFVFAAVLALGVLRAVIRIVLKGIADLFSDGTPSAPGRRPGPLPRSAALKKDPVCGTFIDPASAHQKTVKGQTYYFCSAECRDKFAG